MDVVAETHDGSWSVFSLSSVSSGDLVDVIMNLRLAVEVPSGTARRSVIWVDFRVDNATRNHAFHRLFLRRRNPLRPEICLRLRLADLRRDGRRQHAVFLALAAANVGRNPVRHHRQRRNQLADQAIRVSVVDQPLVVLTICSRNGTSVRIQDMVAPSK